MKVAVIGAGAAGFFAALSVHAHHPDAEIVIVERSDKLLSKVKVSGGGRCNVTNGIREVSQLIKNYPRGGKSLKKAFEVFGTAETVAWFESRGVALKTESDGRMFPVSDRSQSIVDCLLDEAEKAGIRIHFQTRIDTISLLNDGFVLHSVQGDIHADKLIVATGGSPKEEGLAWLQALGHAIEKPVPSLFTFNLEKSDITALMGLSVSEAEVRIVGTDLTEKGPVLITHWGFSGPAVLKLSARGARELAALDYTFQVAINWCGGQKEHALRAHFASEVEQNRLKKAINTKMQHMPSRLWEYHLQRAGISSDLRWADMKKDQFNRLINGLTNDQYAVKGKTTFKDEFVTCGGVSLSDVDMLTMESKKVPGMFFAGEVLDIDGVTGGFNFQAAWTTGYLAGKLAVRE